MVGEKVSTFKEKRSFDDFFARRWTNKKRKGKKWEGSTGQDWEDGAGPRKGNKKEKGGKENEIMTRTCGPSGSKETKTRGEEKTIGGKKGARGQEYCENARSPVAWKQRQMVLRKGGVCVTYITEEARHKTR